MSKTEKSFQFICTFLLTICSLNPQSPSVWSQHAHHALCPPCHTVTHSDGKSSGEVSAASPTAPAKSAEEGWIPILADKKRFLNKEKKKKSLANSCYLVMENFQINILTWWATAARKISVSKGRRFLLIVCFTNFWIHWSALPSSSPTETAASRLP